jgi:hypothetical protein
MSVSAWEVRTGELPGPAQEAHRLLAVAHHVQRAVHRGQLERFRGHQHVPWVVLDQQHLDDLEPGWIEGVTRLGHLPASGPG